MRTRFGLALFVIMAAIGLCRPAEARVDIHIDLASQTMRVDSARGTYVWPISSARAGYRTPRGTFGIRRMEVMHRSHKYHNSPMPHSLFFAGGYAIHGTYETGSLGRPASHGCVRIAPENAAALFQMVAQEGGRIAIQGSSPGYDRRDYGRATRYAAHRSHRDNGYAQRGTVDPSRALGYAPLPDPSVSHWLDDPFGSD